MVDCEITNTTNYVLSDFNKITRDRNIYGEGGVPIHKIINDIYDFMYNYIFLGKNNYLYYLHAILKPKSNEKPDTPILVSLKGKQTKDLRLQEYTKIYKILINIIDDIFSKFIRTNLTRSEKISNYRTDCRPDTIKISFDLWNQEIKPKLIELGRNK